MQIQVVIPGVGESVNEAVLAEWYKKDGDQVAKDEPLLVIETDKVTLEVNAPETGIVKIKTPEGETVPIGAVVGFIETEGAAAEAPAKEPEAKPEAAPKPEPAPALKEAPAPQEAPAPVPVADKPLLSPSVRRLIAQSQVDPTLITGTGPGGRITKGDVLTYLEGRPLVSEKKPAEPAPASAPAPEEAVTRKPMTPIRKRIAARLLEAKQNTAMLTTFNDVDLSRVMEIRNRFKDDFNKKYGVSLGFMSFFTKASVEALKEFPAINAFIEGDDVVYHDYYHVGMAIGSPRGLVVPVIRHADRLSFAEIEQAIVDYVSKIKENRLELADLEGGTFTITNGGVFGSLLSTPILNTPQSGILGMHRIDERPVVVDGEIVVRPMMYLALSYDHRIVDGREAVTFLKRIKECLENPERMMVEI